MKTMTSPKSSKNKTPAVPVPRSRRALEALVAEIAALKLEEVRLAAELDARLRLAREQLEPALANLRAQLTAQTAAVRAWAEAHPDAFAGRRTLELPVALLGWRASPPALKPCAGWTWERVTAALKAAPAWQAYLRVREEPNKIRLLADRVALGDAALATVGLWVTQEELFFVEPRLEATGVPARESTAA
ncbi:MAG: host-nuclease inhibitor Gam family protein [Verrucomicrobiae bacterium]|nr:host-nuclease inhibitor Gam family protein [Verrucomicrobiae bacterium]